MEFKNIRALRGPNIWTRSTALEVAVDLGEMKFPVREIPGFESRLREWLPALYQPAALPENRADGLPGALTLAHILERSVVALEAMSGSPVAFSRTLPATKPGVYNVVVEYHEEEVGRQAFETARALIDAAVYDRPFDIFDSVAKLRSLDQQIRLGPSTGSIVKAAKERGDRKSVV